MTTLILTLKKKWFDMIVAGTKKEEYRALTSYWAARLEAMEEDRPLEFREYKYVRFVNGYRTDSPSAIFVLKSIKIGRGRSEWGAVKGKLYYVISIGRQVQPAN